MSMNENAKNVKITVFGEILWDIFGDERTIGGAPFNFAAHAARLGADVELISAVGDDELGRDAIAAARGFGVGVDMIATLDVDTGYCRVTLDGSSPTLAQRGEVSAATLCGLLSARDRYGEIFYDVNIRGNHWARGVIDSSARAATILKLSREEIVMMDIDAAYEPGAERAVCEALADKYQNLRLVALTLDRDGSAVYDARTREFYRSPIPTSKPLSTVGAGDSFSACFLVNYLRGEGIERSLRRATALSDYVVTQLGAVPFYDPNDKMLL